MTILLVDDEKEIVEALLKLLSESFPEHEILSSSSAREAKEILNTQFIQLLLTDINMPGINGFDLVLVAKSVNPMCKVIYLTGYNTFDYAYEAIKSGCDDFLLKMSSPNEIVQALRKTLEDLEREYSQNEKLEEAKRLLALQKPTQEDENAIAFVKRYIWENLSSEISLNALSGMVYLNPSYLSRLFKREVGVTLTEYIQNVRIQEAKQLLRETNIQIQEICTRVGLDSPAYFARVFRKATGCSPNDYRSKWYGEK